MAAATEAEMAAVGKGGAGDAERGAGMRRGTAAEGAGLCPSRAPRMIPGTGSSAPSQ